MEDRKAVAAIKFQKRLIATRYWLLGQAADDPEYFKTVKALEETTQRNSGFRKDGITPKADHQVGVCLFIRTISSSLIDAPGTLTTSLLHDDIEDHSVTEEDVSRDYGAPIGRSVYLVSKKSKMQRFPEKDYDTFFAEMAGCPRASIVKPADRSYNISSMIGVFKHEKQVQYIEEVEKYFLPMIKTAQRRFPEQEMAYENLKHMLRCQIELIKAIHAAVSFC